MRMRMLSILERIQQGLFLPLLSTPTHNGGWLAPAQLLERQQQWLQAGVTPDSYDLTLALLRIPISEREALAAQPQLHSELRNALRYIVGADSTIEQMDTALFQVALYAREPVRTSTTLNLGPGSIFDQIYEDETNRWRAIALPALRESVFAVGIRWAAKLVQDGVQSHDEGVRTYFEFLTESGAPLERKALILIAIGLIIVDRQCQRFARDAMTIAIDEGRLDTQALGREISAFLYSENSKPERLAKSLKEVARKGKLYTDAVRQVIEYALPGDPTLAPAGLIAVLELLNQLLSGNKMQNEETQKFLQSMPPGGKAGKVITELLRR